MRAKFWASLTFYISVDCNELNDRGKIWYDRRARTTGKPECPESQNDRKARTTGKPERPESKNDRKARTTGKSERPKNQNDRKTRTTGKPERPESQNNRKAGMTMKAGTTRKSEQSIFFPECYSCKKIYLILIVAAKAFVLTLQQNLLSSNSERSDLRFEA